MTKNIKIMLGVAIVAIALIVLGTAVRGTSPASIKIGALLPLSGGLASYGEPAQKAAMLAVGDINAKGGIGGKKLSIDFQDHKCDSKLAVSAFKELHDIQGTRFFIAAACSGTILGITPELTDSVLMTSVATTPKITGASPLLFRNYASDLDESRLFADEIKNKGYKTVGVINEETDYAKGLVLSLQKFLHDADVKITVEGFAANSTDVRTQVTKIKELDPDVVFISPQTVASGNIILGEMKKQAFKPRLIVNENILKSSDLLSRYGDLLEGAKSADYILGDDQRLQAVLSSYKEKYGVDCPQKNICSTVYDDVNLLAEAIGRVGYDARAVASYLQTSTHDGTSGKIGFDLKNDRKNAGYSLFDIKGGKAIKAD